MEVGSAASRPSVDEQRRALSAELEAALLHEVRREWHRLNDGHFRGALRAPSFSLPEATSRLGRFDAASRTLELSREFCVSQPWPLLVEVLKHEMAHQYVFEVLRAEDESAHGPAFREVCERLGIDARATGLPAQGEPAAEEDRVLGRIARLLALAESSSVHEAESAMNAAQRLMLKYNLERAALRSSGRGGDARAYSFRVLGKPTGRVTESERMIATILGDHFFVEVIWVPVYRAFEQKRGSVLEICGSTENLEMATYVHSFLVQAGDRLWAEHQQRLGIASNRDRRTFLAGVMGGFYAKLNQERRSQQKEGLVWVGDADLRRYYKKRHPHVVTVRYGGAPRNDAHAQGRSAGQSLVLHRPLKSGPSGAGPKLLGR